MAAKAKQEARGEEEEGWWRLGKVMKCKEHVVRSWTEKQGISPTCLRFLYPFLSFLFGDTVDSHGFMAQRPSQKSFWALPYLDV
jgi:hypothetical protein